MVNETDEFKLLRFGILEEMNKKFVEIMEKLNANNSDLSKELAEDIKKNYLKNLEEHKALKDWMEYEVNTLKTSNKIILDPERGLIQKMEKKVETCINLATDACKANAESRDLVAASKAEVIISKDEVKKASWYLMANVIVLVTFALGAFSVYTTLVSKATKDLSNQDKMISALQEKITQDAKNQSRTEEIMNKLYKKLGGQ